VEEAFSLRVRKSNPNSKKEYEYLHLVENVRTENGPRQRLILNLGTLQLESEQYKELANFIEAMLTGQEQLFSANRHIEKLARTAAEKIRSKQAVDQGVDESDTTIYEQIDAASMQASQLRSLGAEYVCHCIWNELNINAVLLCEGVSEPILPRWPYGPIWPKTARSLLMRALPLKRTLAF